MKDFTLEDKKLSVLTKILLIGFLVILAEIIDKEVIFPTLKSTLISLIDIIKDSEFLSVIMSSILRSLIGFLISLLMAFITGILSSVSKFIYNLMKPIINFLSSVPIMAIIILALIWFSNNIVPMFVAFLMVFPILYDTVLNAILNVDNKIIEMAKVYKVNKLTIINNIYLPSIFISLKQVSIIALSTTLKMVIAGEALSQPKYAIGSSLQLEKMYFNTSGVFAWIIIILCISKLLECLTKIIINKVDTRDWK